LLLLAGCRTELWEHREAGAQPVDAGATDGTSVILTDGALADIAVPPAFDLPFPVDIAIPPGPDLPLPPDFGEADLTVCTDNDHDGYTTCNGDCDDSDPYINPGAKDIIGDNVDYDCDGLVGVLKPCDANIPYDTPDAMKFAYAMEICPDKFLLGATFSTLADPTAHQVAPDFGIFSPRAGINMALLSNGIAADADDKNPDFVQPQPGTAFVNELPNPLLMGNNCGGADAVTVDDMTELTLTLKAPTNAKSFSFDFSFFSAEYPEYVCQTFNDKFLAIVKSQQFSGNASFDGKGNPITVNNGFFTVTQAKDLQGTGYDQDDGNGTPIGGGTGWLTTTSPVVPGETITLRFIIFDEGDHIFDSSVLIDNFRWSLIPAMGPNTHRDGGVDAM
jgi:hypothetical protein